MTDRLNIAIVGAGIGGLSAALALNARGMDVTVFEDAEAPREAGAGISIPPNAARLLRRTSLCGAIEKITTWSQGLTLRTSQGELVSRPGAPALTEAIRLPPRRTARHAAGTGEGNGSIGTSLY